MSEQFDNTAGPLTTESGAPVSNNNQSEAAGVGGPLLIQDQVLLEKLAHFNRERIPERVVHARGAGAYGTFTVTADVTKYTKANFLSQVGKETETFLRFSTVAGNLGSADAVRDPRGFALKFYTEEGNYDLVGNNTPVFFIRDAIKFPDFIHTQKRDPYTGSQEADNVWDFWGLSPESTHQVTWLFGDRGIPATLRHMDGFGSHTFQWVNEAGEQFWVKYHFKTDQGIKNLTGDEANKLAGEDPDSHQRDLREAIERGDYPSWTVQVQIMPAAEAANYRFNPFDLTKVWLNGDYPRITIGKLELNRNPENVFAEVEQSIFSPAHFVPGIGPSPTRCCRAACSRTATPTATASAPTPTTCRSTARTRLKRATATATASTTTAATRARRTTSRTPSAARTRPASRSRRRSRSAGPPASGRPRSTPRTTTSCRPGTSTTS